jgi:hypothetical protein
VVEQWTENPCVSGSIPLLDNLKKILLNMAKYLLHSETGFYYMISLYFISVIFIFYRHVYPLVVKGEKTISNTLEDYLFAYTNCKPSLVGKIDIFVRLNILLIIISSVAYFLYCYHPDFYTNYIFYCLQIMFSQPKW